MTEGGLGDVAGAHEASISNVDTRTARAAKLVFMEIACHNAKPTDLGLSPNFEVTNPTLKARLEFEPRVRLGCLNSPR